MTIATYAFDGLNRRVQETVYNAGRDGQRRNRLLLRRGRADPGGAGGSHGQRPAVTTQYVWDANSADTPVAEIQKTGAATPQTYYCMTDGNNDVTGLVARCRDGEVAERYVLLAVRPSDVLRRELVAADHFAEGGNDNGVGPQNTATPGVASNIGNQILYCGYYFDPETAAAESVVTSGAVRSAATGNYQDAAREYDATLGDFTSPDPMGYGGERQSYQYCDSSPTCGNDPSGMAPVLAFRMDGMDPTLSGPAMGCFTLRRFLFAG